MRILLLISLLVLATLVAAREKPHKQSNEPEVAWMRPKKEGTWGRLCPSKKAAAKCKTGKDDVDNLLSIKRPEMAYCKFKTKKG